MPPMVCLECRQVAANAARAALDVLADHRASATDRRVAGEVATRALETLQTRPGDRVTST